MLEVWKVLPEQTSTASSEDNDWIEDNDWKIGNIITIVDVL